MRKYKSRMFSVEEEKIKLPNGNIHKFSMVKHPGSVAILPIYKGKIVLTKEYRAVVGRWIYGLPAGTREKGEPAIKTAARELLEETGYSSRRIRFLFKAYLSPGYTTELMHFFLAEDLQKRGTKLEPDEVIRTRLTTFSEALDMIRSGKIKDNKSITALLYYKFICGGK